MTKFEILNETRATRTRSWMGMCILAASVTFSLFAARHAAAQVVVPPGCGPFSGSAVPPNCQVFDFQAQCGVVFNIPAVNCVYVFGSPCTDDITGNDGSQATICGFDGDDVIEGRGSIDHISGGSGEDTLSGFEGADVLHGGPGRDELYGADEAGQIVVPANDILEGGSGPDFIEGGSGNDILDGQGGNDILVGGAGTDDLLGGGGNDFLDGGDGNDTGDGEAGSDDCFDVESPTSCVVL